MRKLIAIILVCSLQSCGVYRGGKDQTLENAVKSGHPIKVKTINGDKVTFKSVYKTEGRYYGIKTLDQDAGPIELKPDEITAVYIKSKTGTVVASSLLGLSAGYLLLYVIVNDSE